MSITGAAGQQAGKLRSSNLLQKHKVERLVWAPGVGL